MVERFTESQIDEFKECFSLFDGDSDGMVTEKELGLIMRSLGENITHFEIEEFMKKAGKQKVRFPEFLKMMAEQTGKMINTEKEILAAFTALDRDKTGSVSRTQLLHLMTGSGDKLSREECDQMLRDLGLEHSSSIQYAAFLLSFLGELSRIVSNLVRAVTH
ncbi:calmodulin-like isoform X1 [Montipora capricornis]|uniref:calmodulin-like isoform X1 n=1 Tax=Montipora capricornis TaxID=246305 RepID=UPI0035F1391C